MSFFKNIFKKSPPDVGYERFQEFINNFHDRKKRIKFLNDIFYVKPVGITFQMTAKESRKMVRSQMAWRSYFNEIIRLYTSHRSEFILYHDIERTKYYKKLDKEGKKEFFNDCMERVDEFLGKY